MINLITDQQRWTKNQIRKRVESYIAQIQTHGDEQLLTRINDAVLLGVLPADYDASGAEIYRNELYLPRALMAGAMADQMAADNKQLDRLVILQNILSEFTRLGVLLEGDNALPAQVEDEDGQLIDNPALLAAAVEFGDVLALIDAASADDWRLVAQRLVGAEIADPVELNLAVIRLLPTIELLESFVEGEGLGSIDKRFNVETERQRMIDELTPVEEVEPDVVV